MIDFAFDPEDIPEGFDFQSLFTDEDFLNGEVDIEIIESSEIGGEDDGQEPSEEDHTQFPTFTVEIWGSRSPDNQDVYFFWIILALGGQKHDCLNEGHPYYTEEIVLQKAIELARKKKLPINQKIFFVD